MFFQSCRIPNVFEIISIPLNKALRSNTNRCSGFIRRRTSFYLKSLPLFAVFIFASLSHASTELLNDDFSGAGFVGWADDGGGNWALTSGQAHSGSTEQAGDGANVVLNYATQVFNPNETSGSSITYSYARPIEEIQNVTALITEVSSSVVTSVETFPALMPEAEGNLNLSVGRELIPGQYTIELTVTYIDTTFDTDSFAYEVTSASQWSQDFSVDAAGFVGYVDEGVPYFTWDTTNQWLTLTNVKGDSHTPALVGERGYSRSAEATNFQFVMHGGRAGNYARAWVGVDDGQGNSYGIRVQNVDVYHAQSVDVGAASSTKIDETRDFETLYVFEFETIDDSINLYYYPQGESRGAPAFTFDASSWGPNIYSKIQTRGGTFYADDEIYLHSVEEKFGTAVAQTYPYVRASVEYIATDFREPVNVEFDAVNGGGPTDKQISVGITSNGPDLVSEIEFNYRLEGAAVPFVAQVFPVTEPAVSFDLVGLSEDVFEFYVVEKNNNGETIWASNTQPFTTVVSSGNFQLLNYATEKLIPVQVAGSSVNYSYARPVNEIQNVVAVISEIASSATTTVETFPALMPEAEGNLNLGIGTELAEGQYNVDLTINYIDSTSDTDNFYFEVAQGTGQQWQQDFSVDAAGFVGFIDEEPPYFTWDETNQWLVLTNVDGDSATPALVGERGHSRSVGTLNFQYTMHGGRSSSTARAWVGMTDLLGNTYGLRLQNDNIYHSASVEVGAASHTKIEEARSFETVYVLELEVIGDNLDMYYYPQGETRGVPSATVDIASWGPNIYSMVQSKGADSYSNDEIYLHSVIELSGTPPVQPHPYLQTAVEYTPTDYQDSVTIEFNSVPGGAVTDRGITLGVTSNGPEVVSALEFYYRLQSDGGVYTSQLLTGIGDTVNFMLTGLSDGVYQYYVEEKNAADEIIWSSETGLFNEEVATLGSYLLYSLGQDWTDYKASFTASSAGNGEFGLLFRYQDAGNFYRFGWDAQNTLRTLTKRVAGVDQALEIPTLDNVPYTTGVSYAIEVIAQAQTIELKIDGQSVFQTSDSSLSQGSIALHSFNNSDSVFDDVVVEDLVAGEVNQLPEIAAVMANPGQITGLGSSELGVNATDADSDLLIYSWEILNGGLGELLNADSQNAIYQAVDVTENTDVVLRVSVSDGQDVASADITIRVQKEGYQNQIPLLTITSPSNGSVFAEGVWITLQAIAVDEDVAINEKIKWFDGETFFAEGASVSTGALSVGNHFITASAKDKDGDTGVASINLVIKTDADSDGITDDIDNCVDIANSAQEDLDDDGFGDLCDNDRDGDGVDNAQDAYPDDSSRIIFDGDGDGVADNMDNCPNNANSDQFNLDGDQFGDLCDDDRDGDGVPNTTDGYPDDPSRTSTDPDNDGVIDGLDNCPNSANSDQLDSDGDQQGDACDDDRDGDGVINSEDAFPDDASESADLDSDGIGDNTDSDRDGDGVINEQDYYPDDDNKTVLVTATIDTPDSLTTVGTSSLEVTGTLVPSTAVLTVNGIVIATDTGFYGVDVPLEEGHNTIVASAEFDGQVVTDSITVSLDLTPPYITVDSHQDGQDVFDGAITVTGLINDIVRGTIEDTQVNISVNGMAASVVNRSYSVIGVPLVEGINTINVVGTDQVGNTATTIFTVNYIILTGKKIELVSGQGQTASIGETLAAPLVIRLIDEALQPVVGESVIFRVTQGAGQVGVGEDSEGRAVIVETDAQGQASTKFQIGSRSGTSNHRVSVNVVGYDDEVIFNASASGTLGDKISLNSGNNQRGAVGQVLPEPLIVAVFDEGANAVSGARVLFEVTKGEGQFKGGSTNYETLTDSDGRASVEYILGLLEGLDAQRVTATLLDAPELDEELLTINAGFTLTAFASGNPGETTVSGVVLDNQDAPLPGVTVRIEMEGASPREAVTNEQGLFLITEVPVGPVHLIADGSTTTVAGEYPSLSYNFVTIAGVDNPLASPIYMVKLNQDEAIYAGLEDVELTLDQYPGFKLEVAKGSVTFSGGQREGYISATAVNASKLPMTPPNGMQPKFIVTIQPTGALFDPPARLSLPNFDGYAPGSQVEMFSYDHDMEEFVTIGLGTVSEDSSVIKSNIGVGVIKAGWQGGSKPNDDGCTHACEACERCTADCNCVSDEATAKQPGPNQVFGDCQTLLCDGSEENEDSDRPDDSEEGDCRGPKCEDGDLRLDEPDDSDIKEEDVACNECSSGELVEKPDKTEVDDKPCFECIAGKVEPKGEGEDLNGEDKPCKECDGQGGNRNRDDDYELPKEDCEECKNGEAVPKEYEAIPDEEVDVPGVSDLVSGLNSALEKIAAKSKFPSISLSVKKQIKKVCCKEKDGDDTLEETYAGTADIPGWSDTWTPSFPWSGNWEAKIFGSTQSFFYGLKVTATLGSSLGVSKTKKECEEENCWTGSVGGSGSAEGTFGTVIDVGLPDECGETGDKKCDGLNLSVNGSSTMNVTGDVGCGEVIGAITSTGVTLTGTAMLFEGTWAELGDEGSWQPVAGGTVGSFSFALPD